jgi:hypothetical protein
MDSFYYVASLIGVLLLVRWYVRAERSGDASSGLFGIRGKSKEEPRYKSSEDSS